MFCVNCGAKNVDGAEFCANCGYKLNVTAPQTVAVAPASEPVSSAPVVVETVHAESTPAVQPANVQPFSSASATSPTPTPQAIAQPVQPVVVQLEIATRRRRLVSYIIDIFIIQIAVGIIGAFLGSSDSATIITGLATLVGYFFYFYLMELEYGKTLGKMLMGLKVVRRDGGALDSSAALTRSIIRYLPFEALAILGTTKTCMHDRWSKTVVVRG